MATYAYPVIGGKAVGGITSGDVLTVLSPIWTVKPETASRIRQRVEIILDWAVAQGYRQDNAAGKPILRVLPRIPKVKAHWFISISLQCYECRG